MVDFYVGKTCVIAKTAQGVEWAHVMDAALAPSTINVG